MSDKLPEIVLNSAPPRKVPLEAFIVASEFQAKWMQRQLREKGIADDYIVLVAGTSVMGRRFRRIFVQGDITREMSAREFERYDRWMHESVRCRLTDDGQIITLP